MRKFAKIERVSDSGAEYARGTPAPEYLNDFALAQQSGKTIVDIQRDRQKALSSYITNLQNILQNKPAYANVDEAVKDMRERTGLNTYLSRIAQRNADGSLTDSAKKKILASIEEAPVPDVLKQEKYKEELPKIIEYLEEKIKTRNGHVDASALQEEISKLYKLDLRDSLSPEIKKYIKFLIDDFKAKYGTSDHSASPADFARAGEGDEISDIGKGENFFSLMEAR